MEGRVGDTRFVSSTSGETEAFAHVAGSRRWTEDGLGYTGYRI